MSTLRVTLRCLIHPVTLLSIGLLLANDHWLKAAFPSWWTGKLSDFAGLFFFPFLLAPLFGLFLDWKNISPVTAGKIAFGLTATWFASFKTLPLANTATSSFLGILLGHPVQLVLDPTDLIALPVLVPAWLLWRHETRVGDEKPSKVAWLALSVAVLATAATSPLPPIVSIQRLTTEDGLLCAYHGYTQYQSSGAQTDVIRRQPVACSEDGGHTWRYQSYGVGGPALPAPQPTRQACDPGNPQVCYRLGTEEIEQSNDGGKTYQVAWSIPWGRRYFIQRENQGTFLGQSKGVDIGPYDLVFINPVGANGLSAVVFAMGNEGLLIRTPDGAWERYAVGNAIPSPFAAKNAEDSLRIMPVETDVAIFLALLMFSFLSLRAASEFVKLGDGTHTADWAISPLVGTDALLLLGWGAYALSGTYSLGPFWLFGLLALSFPTASCGPAILLPVVFVIFLIILPNWTWQRIKQLPPDPKIAEPVFWRAVSISTALALVAYGPFVLWAFGIIPLYELAVAIASVLGVVVIGIGIKIVPGELPPPETRSV